MHDIINIISVILLAWTDPNIHLQHFLTLLCNVIIFTKNGHQCPLVSWISRPPWGRGLSTLVLRSFHNGMLECWNVIKFGTLRPTYLIYCSKRLSFVHQQQPASIDLCSACGANSVRIISCLFQVDCTRFHSLPPWSLVFCTLSLSPTSKIIFPSFLN